MSRTTEIRRLNDAFRTSLSGGQLLLTMGVSDLDPFAQAGLLAKVRRFAAFTPDNDPHGEHDFGAVEHAGTRYFWKIDAYDLQMQMFPQLTGYERAVTAVETGSTVMHLP